MNKPLDATQPDLSNADSTENTTAREQASTLTPASVAAFLKTQPDFFEHHRSLLAALRLPHESGKTISLVERQVGILRERNMDMRRRMNDLLETARDNDTLFAKTRNLTLALLDCANRQELNKVLATHVLVDFDADFVCCHLQSEAAATQPSLDHLNCSVGEFPFSGLLSKHKASCTSLRENELHQLFPAAHATEQAQANSGSAVLISINVADTAAVLAIGSRDATRFSNDMDTLFVTYIAEVLGKVLERLS